MTRYRHIINTRPRAEWLALINEWIHDERDRAMLARRLLDGMTMEEIAEEYGLSAVQTQKIIKKSRTQLFSHV